MIVLAGPAVADEPPATPEPVREAPGAVAAFDLQDGTSRVLLQPEFREATLLRTDLLALKLEGLRVELVTPVAVRPTPLFDKAAPKTAPARLLLLGPPDVVARAQAHALRLDVPPRMVSVSILLSEVQRSGVDSTGTSLLYDKDGVGDPKGTLFRSFETGFTPDRFLISSLTGSRPFEGTAVRLGDGNVLGGAWETTLRMLAKRGEAQFLAWPNLLCAEGRPAEIQTVENLPHIRLEQAGTAPNVRLTSEQAGLRLAVTALRVGAEHAVLDIDMWLNVPEAPERASSYPGGLQLNTRRVRTRVTVRDGEPLLLGGLFLRRWAHLRKGLPRLSGMSLVDQLLFADDKNCVDTELVLLIRGRIRTPSAEAVRRARDAGPVISRKRPEDPWSDPWRVAPEPELEEPRDAPRHPGAPKSSADLTTPPAGGAAVSPLGG